MDQELTNAIHCLGADPTAALRNVCQRPAANLVKLSAVDLTTLAEGCTAYNWHAKASYLLGMARVKS